MECLAGKFVAKEAFVKAIGVEIQQEIWFRQIEVLNRETGKRYIQVSGEANRKLKRLNAFCIHVSVSHDHNIATAIVILEQ